MHCLWFVVFFLGGGGGGQKSDRWLGSGQHLLSIFLVFAYLWRALSKLMSHETFKGRVTQAFMACKCTLLFAGTIFCEFLRFGKIAKLSARNNFYQHITHSGVPQSQTGWCFHFETCIIILFWLFPRFLFFLRAPSRAQESDIDNCWSFTSVCSHWQTDAPCGMFHVDLHEDCMYFNPDNTNITVGFKVELLPLGARSRKI